MTMPLRSMQRATAVARIDRGVGLHERDRADLPHGAHDASRDGVGQHAERRADGDDLLTDARAAARPELERRLCGVRVVDLHDREVAAGRDRDDPRRVAPRRRPAV